MFVRYTDSCFLLWSDDLVGGFPGDGHSGRGYRPADRRWFLSADRHLQNVQVTAPGCLRVSSVNCACVHIITAVLPCEGKRPYLHFLAKWSYWYQNDRPNLLYLMCKNHNPIPNPFRDMKGQVGQYLPFFI